MDSYEPMEIDAEYPQQESPAPTPLPHDTIPSSPPSKYLRVAPEAHTAPLLATRTTPILLASGHQIPLAQSRPTLVPRQTHLPAAKRPRQKASSTHIIVEPIQREEDEAIRDALQSDSQPPQEDSLGLYDDPDAGDEVHRDPLLHTERHNEDSDADAIPDVQFPPFNSQHAPVDQVQITPRSEFEAPLNPRQVYQDAHPDWFGRIIIIMVAILHSKHRVSFRACALILHCVTIILLSLGILHPTQPLPTTLNTVIHRLDLHDRFTIYPVCGCCHRIFPTDIPTNTLCPDCDTGCSNQSPIGSSGRSQAAKLNALLQCVQRPSRYHLPYLQIFLHVEVTRQHANPGDHAQLNQGSFMISQMARYGARCRARIKQTSFLRRRPHRSFALALP